MRESVLALACIVLGVIIAAGWSWLPLPQFFAAAAPSVIVLAAIYFGFSSRKRLLGAVLASVVTAYVGDVVAGATGGMSGSAAALLTLACALLQGRVMLGRRERLAAIVSLGALSFIVVQYAVVQASGIAQPPLGEQLWSALPGCVVTGLFAPLSFFGLRRLDAALAKTMREREAVLEGRF